MLPYLCRLRVNLVVVNFVSCFSLLTFSLHGWAHIGFANEWNSGNIQLTPGCLRDGTSNKPQGAFSRMGLLQLSVTWYMLVGKLPIGTSKTKKIQIYLDEVTLFWMSQWAACPPACTMWAHVTTSCKRPNKILQYDQCQFLAPNCPMQRPNVVIYLL